MAYILLSFLLLVSTTYVTAGAVVYHQKFRSEDVVNMVNEKALDFMDNMLSCMTNRTFLETLFDFGFYGCYCGFGGFGQPVDGVDRCCQAHDACYGATHRRESGVCYSTIAAYVAPYKFKLHECDTKDAYVTCEGIDKYKWYDPLPKCSVSICKCDRDLAHCVAKEPFHEKNRFYNRLKCFDGDIDKQAQP